MINPQCSSTRFNDDKLRLFYLSFCIQTHLYRISKMKLKIEVFNPSLSSSKYVSMTQMGNRTCRLPNLWRGWKWRQKTLQLLLVQRYIRTPRIPRELWTCFRPLNTYISHRPRLPQGSQLVRVSTQTQDLHSYTATTSYYGLSLAPASCLHPVITPI